MIVQIPVGIRTTVRLPRSGRIVRVRVPGSISVDVPEARGADAPAGLLLPSAIREPIRILDGILFAPIAFTPVSDDPDAWPVADRMRMRHLRPEGTDLAHFVSSHLRRIGMDPSASEETSETVYAPNAETVLGRPIRPRDVVFDGRDALAAEAQAFADRELLLVDGVPHRRVRAPSVPEKEVRRICGSLVEDVELPWRLAPWLDDVTAVLGPAAAEAAAGDDRFDVRILDEKAVRAARARRAENVDLGHMARVIGTGGTMLRETFDRDPPSDAFAIMSDVPSVPQPDRSYGRGATAGRIPWSRDRTQVVLQSSGGFPTAARPLLSKRLHTNFVQAEIPRIPASSLRTVALHRHAHFPETLAADGGFLVRLDDLDLPRGTTIDDGPESPMRDQYRDDEIHPQGLLVPLSKASIEALGGGGLTYGERNPLYQATLRLPDRAGWVVIGEDDADEFAVHRLAALDDGSVLARCPEPVLLVTPLRDAEGRTDVSTSHSWAARLVPGIRPPFAFRLDEASDALGFVSDCGWRTRRDPPMPETVDGTALAFDSAGWNLRAAMSRILERLEPRFAAAGTHAAMAAVRLSVRLLAWRGDASRTFDPETETLLLEEASAVLAAFDHPLLDGLAEEGVRGLAERSLAEIVRRRDAAAKPEEDGETYEGFVM